MTGIISETNPLPLNQEFETQTSSNMILYRQYSDKAIAGSICSLIAPANPHVVDEFNVNNGGFIKYKHIRKIEQKTDDPRVSINYVLSFSFQNIILSNGNTELKYENYNFGEYFSTNSTLHFSFFNEFSYCETNSDLIT